MNGETSWLPSLVALGAAGVGGLLLVLTTWRRRPSAPIPEATDLERQRDALYQQIRDLDAAFGATNLAEYRAERARLEIEAARTLRELSAPAAPAPPPAPSNRWVDRHPQLAGGLWGAGIVAFGLALWVGLEESTAPRAEGMSITGNAQSGGMPGAADLLAEARAEMEARPGDLDAKARYGFAVLQGGDVRAAFDVANEITAVDPGHALARTLQAVILLQIGDTTMAAGVLDKVLATHPDTPEALGYRGAIHFQAGEYDQAIARWEHLLAVDPAQRPMLEPLLARARDPAAPPPMASTASRPAPAPDPADVVGTVRLRDGVPPPARGTLFLFARPAGVEAGPPAAAKRLDVPPLPQDFRLGPGDSPMGGPFPASMTLTARLDADGNPTTKGPDDLTARAENVAPGATGVILELAPAGP